MAKQSAQAALAAINPTKGELAAARALATEMGLGFDPATILALIEMIRNLIAGCKKSQEADGPEAAQQACFNALHDNPATKRQNKRVKAAAKKSLPRAERSDENVDALLEKAAAAPAATFSRLWNEVDAE